MLNRLKMLFTEDPSLSIRKASVDVGISYSLCRDILLKDLHLKPYKYQSAHQLLPLDYEKMVIFAQWWLGLAKSTYKWLIASDKANFYLTESINNRMWLEERPLDWIEKPLHDEKVLALCGISCRKVYGPYFFEKPVNQHNHFEMLILLRISKIYLKTGVPANLAPILSISNNGRYDHQTSTRVITFYGVILNRKYLSHCRRLWTI